MTAPLRVRLAILGAILAMLVGIPGTALLVRRWALSGR
jgi:hypothetical protein